jgi:hypothetical protein
VGSLNDRLRTTRVDLDHFETVVRRAELIRDFLRDDVAGRVPTDGCGPAAFSQLPDGNQFNQDLSSAERTARELVRKRLERMDQLVSGLRRIAADYRSTEELNRADAARIATLLAPPQPPGRPGPTASA